MFFVPSLGVASIFMPDADYGLIRPVVERDVKNAGVTVSRLNASKGRPAGVEIYGPEELLSSYRSLAYDAKLLHSSKDRQAGMNGEPQLAELEFENVNRKIAETALSEAAKLVQPELLGEGKLVMDSRAAETVARAMVRTEEAMRTDPDYLPAYLFHGHLQLANGNYAAAEETFRGLADNMLVDSFAAEGSMLGRWDIYTYALFAAAQAGKVEDVLGECESALGQNPGFRQNMKELATMLTANRRPDISERLFERMLNYDAKDTETQWSLVLSIEEQGKWKEAENRLRGLLTENPRDARLHYHYGKALVQQGKLEQAVPELETSLRGDLGSEGQEAYQTYNKVIGRLGRAPKEDLIPTVEAIPEKDDDKVFSRAAMDAEHSGDIVGAIKYMKAAIIARPENPEYHAGMGMLLRKQGRMDKAELAFREAVSLDGNLGAAHFGLGLVFQDTGRLRQAAEEFRAALERETDPQAKRTVYAALARVYQASGDLRWAQYYSELAQRQ